MSSALPLTYAGEPVDDNEVDQTYLITECGITVRIPNKDYTPEEIEELMDKYTRLYCGD
ncbi:MAG: hypothetical protein ACI3Y5_08735 [Prevotella sp.]